MVIGLTLKTALTLSIQLDVSGPHLHFVPTISKALAQGKVKMGAATAARASQIL